MSGPKTRPFDEPLEMDNDQPPVSLGIKTEQGGSTSSKVGDIDMSKGERVNDALPYVWFNGVLAALALGLSIGAVGIAYIKTDTVSGKVDAIRDRATVSENHWRNIETEQGIQRAEIDRLKGERK